MILISLDKLKPGMQLACAPILPKTEAELVKEGTVLNSELINKLRRFKHLQGLFMTEESVPPDEIPQETVLTEKLRETSIDNLKGVFQAALLNSGAAGVVQIATLSHTVADIIASVKAAKDVMVNINDLKAYDDYTYHHCLSVAVISIAIGIEMGLSDKELSYLGLAAILHDIGKILLPIQIINKPAKLSNEEYATIKQHPILGIKYLSEHNLIDTEVYSGIAMHHERIDGTGYPFGVKGDELRIYPKIIAVADVYDALTSQRPYRMPMQPFEAVEYLMGKCGSDFDWEVMCAFVAVIEMYPPGSYVKLSNDRYYQVVDSKHNMRPVVRDMLPPYKKLDLNSRENYNLVVTEAFNSMPDDRAIIKHA